MVTLRPNYKTTDMKRRTLLAHVALACATAAYSAPGHGPKEDMIPTDTTKVIDIEEVVVIATPKENSRLRQQALSSTSFSQDELRNKTVGSVKSLSGLVPNLFIPDYGSKLTTSVYVRGIGSRINTPAVGLYVDNIPFIDKSAFDFNYSDIERIDVMRGPQGTLYGRNTMGGLIRVFTKSPFSYQGTDVRLGAATRGEYKASVAHYHRISEQFAFSASTFYQHNSGFFKNRFNGRHIDTDNEFGGRLRAICRPSEATQIDLSVNYEYTNQGGYPYYYTGKVGGDEDRADYIGSISYNRDCGYKRNLVNTGLHIEHTASGFILSSVTGFQYLYDRMHLDQDFTEQDIYTIMQQQNSKTVSQELVLKSKPGQRWQWTTGVSGFYQWLHTSGPVDFQEEGIRNYIEAPVNRIFSSLPPTAPAMGMSLTTRPLTVSGEFDTPTLNGAVYHQSTLNDLLVEGLSLTAGLRLDYEKVRLDYLSACSPAFNFNLSIPGRPKPMVRPLQAVSEFIGQESTDYVQLLPKFTLQYAWNAQNNVYATVSKGYRSGGYNFQMFSDIIQNDLSTAMMNAVKNDEVLGKFAAMMPTQPAKPVNVKETTYYKPEYAWNYEVGTHLTLFNRRLQADFSLFYMDTRDQQLSRFADNGMGRITVNAGKSRSMGAEAALRAQLTDAFSLNGNYGYTYATFTDYLTNARNARGEMADVDYSGNYVPFVPKHTFTAGAQYVFRMKNGCWVDNITLNAHYKAAGRIYWTEQNNASQAFYGVLNARVAFNKGNAQMAFWVNNLLDKDYDAFYFETMGRGFAQQGRPLQAGVELRCCF